MVADGAHNTHRVVSGYAGVSAYPQGRVCWAVKENIVNPTMENCGFAAALKAIEGKWKVDILCELGRAARRFGRLRQSIPAISEKMLAQQLRIQSIPAVYAFFGGRPVDGFMGAVPESQLKEFV
eukprot:gene18456-23579_t